MMVQTTALVRHFQDKKTTVAAVRGMNLRIEQGELVALLGPNGAGKSTLFRMLTTLLPPTDGTATVAGCDIVTDPDGVRARIGYVGQHNSAGEKPSFGSARGRVEVCAKRSSACCSSGQWSLW